MCGHDWCSVRISREIVEFASGKDDRFQWDKAKVSKALTPEQQEILAKRGVLPAEEIHRLAGKTLRGVGADKGKAACHSDVADADTARTVQVVELGVSEIHVSD